MGGHRVTVGDFPDDTPYIGLDWFILDLLGSSMVFILIEKMFPLHREQPIFRPHWQIDFTHFIVNHLLVGLALCGWGALVLAHGGRGEWILAAGVAVAAWSHRSGLLVVPGAALVFMTSLRAPADGAGDGLLVGGNEAHERILAVAAPRFTPRRGR